MLNHKSGNVSNEYLLKLGTVSIYKGLHSKIRHSKIWHSKILARYVNLFGMLCLLFTSTVIHAVNLPFNSSTGPTLLSGGSAHLTVGAKYIYQNIATSTDGVIVDAIVTITNLNGATIGDDSLPLASRTIDTIIATDDRFEPLLNLDILGVDGYIEWQIVFVQDGTVTNATDVGRRAYLDAFTLEAIDVDFTEYFEVIVSNSYTLEGTGAPATELVVSTNGQYTKFQSPASPGANNINIADTEFIVRVNYQNVNEIRFRNGYIGTGVNRQNSLSFFGEVTFTSEDTTIVNVPPTVVNNTGNVSDIDATFNVNLLAGAGDADGNIVLSTVALIDPNDATNLGAVGSPLVIPGVGTYTVDNVGLLSFVPVSGYAGSADILFTVSDALNVSSDRGTLGLTVADIVDTDNDGIDDSLDLDDDNDGVPDTVEIAGSINGGDTDGDGIPDERDLDADGDGISDIVESGLSPAQILVLDTNGDGSIDKPVGANGLANAIENDDTAFAIITYNGGSPLDTDSDGHFDFQDLDSDNDGIHDLAESDLDLAEFDTNNDGVLDANATDADQDGFPDSLDDNDAAFGGVNSDPIDTDGDTVADFRDLDSDNDGIHDLAESGILIPTVVDANNDGVLDSPLTDADGDGIPDSGDSNDAAYGDPQSVAIVNTDGHDVPDYRDLDSDNDSINDIIESGNGGADSDGDGVADSSATDSDGDGVPDSIDTNINAFGDPDAALPDADGDGTPDAQETDSDNDGTNDIVDNGFGGLDTNGDGRIDGAVDSDGDGIPDVIDGSNGFGDAPDLDRDGISDINDIDDDNDGIPDTVEQATAINAGDTDGDGVPDDRDLDADGDGISDIVESGLTPAQIIAFDADNDGVIDATIPVGINGLADTIETDDTINAALDQDGDGSANGPVDTDLDGHPDFQDLDADNDGIHDLIEVGGLHLDPAVVDAGDNGVIDDNGVDADQDGIPDSIDTNDALPGGLSSSPVDTDGDSVANFRDIDSDNDGITDLYESGISPDTTVVDADNDGVLDNPTSDADGDGIPDSGDSNDGAYGDPQGTGVVDTDSDNVPDYLDLDSDNDSIPDVKEAGNQDDNGDGVLDPGGTVTFPPTNTDGTDNPDHLDLDSNNDGTNDIEDAGNGGFDTDGDGKVDGSDDADEDGVLDAVDGEPNGFGNDADNDGDGIPNLVDLDDDNDGIPDAAETDANGNDVDTDGDGIVDRLDRDSDNDGIPDSVEAITTVLDADADGVIDNFVDANNDGLDDRVSLTLMPVDTDGDGTPDFRDLDSDNDGLTDIYEGSGFTVAGDSDSDGILDDLTDLDKDGLADVVDPDVAGGTAGTKLPNPDTDGDGLSNYRDVDSDGDGISDNDENVDADGDGILDNLQFDNLQFDNMQKDDERLETAVNGIGSFGPMSLFAMLLLGFTRLLRSGLVNVLLQKNKLVAILSMLLMLTTFSATAHSVRNDCGRHNSLDSNAEDSEASEDFKKCFYGGVGYLFETHVHPRGEAKTWKTSDDTDAGYNLYLGWHFKPHWFGELSYADLGDAGLSNKPAIATPEKGEISYKISSVHIGYWLFEPERRFNFYAKAGLSSIANNASLSKIPFEKQNNINLTGGIGVQWRSQTSGLFARLAADFYDRDAASVGINVGYYFGGSHKHKTKNVHTPVSPLLGDGLVSIDNDGDGVINEKDLCPDSAIGATVDGRGCVIPDLSLRGVNFRTNSAIITRQSKAILDNAAAALIGAPHINVEVQAHTDNLGDADYNDDLSYRRALAVSQYLEEKGVSNERMEVQGYGERRPAFTNNTRMGRWKNRRVELLIIDR